MPQIAENPSISRLLMSSQRVMRALRLNKLLQSGHVASSRQLADWLGCSRRTVYRCINLLNDSGVNVRFDQQLGGYVAKSSEVELQPGLTDEQVSILALAASTSPFAQLVGFDQIVHQAIGALLATAPERVRQQTNNLRTCLVFLTCTPQLSDDIKELAQLVLNSLATRRQLRARLNDGNGALTGDTYLCPYRLVVSDTAWRLTARSTRPD